MKASIWKNSILSFAAAVILLLLWQLGSNWIDAEIILPPPGKVLAEVYTIVASRVFIADLKATFSRGLWSFLLVMSTGLAAGIAAGKYAVVNASFRPLLAVIKTTPVMSIILIAIVWFHTGTVPVFAAFLITFPIIIENCAAGIRETDKHLIEMAALYQIPALDVLVSVSIPSMLPYIISGARTAIGLTWKVIVAGEILSLPRNGIGSQMQLSQLNLETGKVFAWTLIAILLSALSQGLFSGLLFLAKRRRTLRTSS